MRLWTIIMSAARSQCFYNHIIQRVVGSRRTRLCVCVPPGLPTCLCDVFEDLSCEEWSHDVLRFWPLSLCQIQHGMCDEEIVEKGDYITAEMRTTMRKCRNADVVEAVWCV